MSDRFLVIGGNDAGISAALRARELRPDMTVTMVVADRYPNFSICGLPFFLGGEVADWRNLAHRTRAEIEAEGIDLLLDHRAEAVDPEKRTVAVLGADGVSRELSWDRCWGSRCICPWGPPPTSRAGWPGKTPRGAGPNSPEAWAPNR